MTGDNRDLHEIADEYVLGLLDASEQARVEAEMEHDAVLRGAVAASRDRFLELDLLARPAPVSADLWDRIESGLDPQTIGALPAQAAPASDGPNQSATAVPTTSAPANDNAANGWRLTAFAGMAASLVLAAGLSYALMVAPEPRVIAVLLDDGGEPLVLVEDYGNASARVTPLVDFDVPADRSLQVWTLPSQELGPVSLGLLERSETVTLDGPALPEPKDSQLYEITMEQEGGSPTGRPTGPILVKGFAKLPR